jgi:hypothetical protein
MLSADAQLCNTLGRASASGGRGRPDRAAKLVLTFSDRSPHGAGARPDVANLRSRNVSLLLLDGALTCGARVDLGL